MKVKVDKKNRFISRFDPKTGFYMRTGVIDENGKDTDVDPFMASYPELLDIGIMQTCVCSHMCNVDCYQKAIDRKGKNMPLEDLESILKQSQNKIFQVALGGAGDPDTHENFEEILRLCKQYEIVPNFTTSGILMNDKKAKLCKEYCGAVAVSQHSKLKEVIVSCDDETKELKDEIYIEREKLQEILDDGWNITEDTSDTSLNYRTLYMEENSYTYKAIKLLLENKVKTSIHYVLSRKSIKEAIFRLKNNAFPKGINAVVFLLYKPVGLGREENMLKVTDPEVKEFFKLIDLGKYNFKIGFDSCSCSGLVNFANNINLESIDFCEGGRFSAYIDANMNMMPCSFANQDKNWHISLKEHSIQEVWNSEMFDKFRYSLNNSCSGCKNRLSCGGGCPLVNQITLCNSSERKFVNKED